ncbi:hypothetical protein [Paenibacillus agricola]|uniref:hypothetical protein n=1 Tax=Paenibacillus agricola TaxID=2716264 RepID=UPI001A9D6736|nr:hypothetical protein [Paenibacillus agricola]
MARGRLMLLGSESFLKIKIMARQNETIINVNIEAELLKGITSSYDGIARIAL